MSQPPSRAIGFSVCELASFVVVPLKHVKWRGNQVRTVEIRAAVCFSVLLCFPSSLPPPPLFRPCDVCVCALPCLRVCLSAFAWFASIVKCGEWGGTRSLFVFLSCVVRLMVVALAQEGDRSYNFQVF